MKQKNGCGPLIRVKRILTSSYRGVASYGGRNKRVVFSKECLEKKML